MPRAEGFGCVGKTGGKMRPRPCIVLDRSFRVCVETNAMVVLGSAVRCSGHGCMFKQSRVRSNMTLNVSDVYVKRRRSVAGDWCANERRSGMLYGCVGMVSDGAVTT